MSQPLAQFTLLPGDLIAGKYRVERLIGEGGMGVVVAARHLDLDELVAIKMLVPAALGSTEAMARFAREARASVKIKSEHVARTVDVGKLENGVPYMVMEYLEGTDLGARLRTQGPLPVEQAVDVMLETCEAVAEAHALGIIHRDLKPSNLFLVRKSDGTESVKVLDFGISKVTGLTASGPDVGMTRTQALMGSPLYMSPEQMASSRNVDMRSDIWALGITLHEMLAGSPPYSAETIPELCTKVLMHPAPRLQESRPEIPEGLQQVVDCCLDKEPARRYPNVAEFAHALASFGGQRGRFAAENASRILAAAGMAQSALGPSPFSGEPATAKQSGTVAAWGQTQSSTARRTSLLVGAAALLVVLGSGAAGIFVMARLDRPEAVSSANPARAETAPSAAMAAADSAPAAAGHEAVVEPSPSEIAPSASGSAVAIGSATPLRARPAVAPKEAKAKLEAPPNATLAPRPQAPAPVPAPSTQPKPQGMPDFGGRLY